MKVTDPESTILSDVEAALLHMLSDDGAFLLLVNMKLSGEL